MREREIHVDFSTKEREALFFKRFGHMINKLYSGHEVLWYDGTQFVLWLDFNLFTRYCYTRMDAKIEFYDADGRLIMTVADTSDGTLCSDMIVHAKSLLRTPYPNKYIRQIGAKNGSKCIYGIPIIYDDWRDIAKIRNIRVQYDGYIESPAGGVMIDTLYLDIFTEFKAPKSDSDLFYTVDFKDKYIMEYSESEKSEMVNYGYEASYICDGALIYTGLDENNNHVYDDEGIAEECFMHTDAVPHGSERHYDVVSGRYNYDRVYSTVYSMNKMNGGMHEVPYEKNYFMTHEVFEAHDHPVFLAESCFGFKDTF